MTTGQDDGLCTLSGRKVDPRQLEEDFCFAISRRRGTCSLTADNPFPPSAKPFWAVSSMKLSCCVVVLASVTHAIRGDVLVATSGDWLGKPQYSLVLAQTFMGAHRRHPDAKSERRKSCPAPSFQIEQLPKLPPNLNVRQYGLLLCNCRQVSRSDRVSCVVATANAQIPRKETLDAW